MKNKMENKKVFCINCKYFDGEDFFAGYKCKAFWTYKENYMKKERIFDDARTKNRNNDCMGYKSKFSLIGFFKCHLKRAYTLLNQGLNLH